MELPCQHRLGFSMTMMMMTSSHSMIPAMLATVWMLQLWNNLLLNTAGIFIQWRGETVIIETKPSQPNRTGNSWPKRQWFVVPNALEAEMWRSCIWNHKSLSLWPHFGFKCTQNLHQDKEFVATCLCRLYSIDKPVCKCKDSQITPTRHVIWQRNRVWGC